MTEARELDRLKDEFISVASHKFRTPYSGKGKGLRTDTPAEDSGAHRSGRGGGISSVSDSGFGIPREQQPHIFQRFYRAWTGEQKSGVEMGLYVSKGIVEAHGGRIWFDSQGGKGTTFYV